MVHVSQGLYCFSNAIHPQQLRFNSLIVFLVPREHWASWLAVGTRQQPPPGINRLGLGKILLQGGPLPVVSMVITPFIAVITPQLPMYKPM